MHAEQIIEPVQAFGACLKGLLEKRKISASELARMMAYKSRNSIFRMLDESSGHSARQAFFDRLTGEDPLALEEGERAALAQALEVSRVGEHTFLSNCAMRELMMHSGMETPGPKVYIDTLDQSDDPGFHRALEELARGRKAYITITGCCDRAVFEAIRERIYKTDVTCEVRVKHLIYTGAEEIVRNISAIQPLLYCDCYRAYCLQPGVFSREREAFYRQNCIYALMLDEHGNWFRQTLVLVERGVLIPLQKTEARKDDPMSRYFAADIENMPMLKVEMPKGGSMESYLEYIKGCRRLEQSRATYIIKQDLSLTCVHPEILMPCVRDEFWQMAGERAEAWKAEFWKIHMDRWENAFSRKRENHIIFSAAAMKRFAQTGRQSDHFFAIRPYTRQERAAILQNLRDQARENPCFHVHFFKGCFEPTLTEIGLYEGMGTLMTKPYTDYNLDSDHTEAIVTQKEFCERYKEFYMHDLLARYVISEKETIELLDKLIEMAKNAP